jgi:hypothetical protein
MSWDRRTSFHLMHMRVLMVTSTAHNMTRRCAAPERSCDSDEPFMSHRSGSRRLHARFDATRDLPVGRMHVVAYPNRRRS